MLTRAPAWPACKLVLSLVLPGTFSFLLTYPESARLKSRGDSYETYAFRGRPAAGSIPGSEFHRVGADTERRRVALVRQAQSRPVTADQERERLHRSRWHQRRHHRGSRLQVR